MQSINQVKKQLIPVSLCLMMLLSFSGCNFIFVNSPKKTLFEEDTPDNTLISPTVSAFLSSLDGGYCLNKSENDVLCWGNSVSDHPEDIAPLVKTRKIHLSNKNIRDVYASQYMTCVITTDGLPYCWGLETAVGSETDNYATPSPVDMTGVLSGKTVKTISLGDAHGCLIASDDLVYCWGENDKGQLGNGSTDYSSAVPVAVNIAGMTVKSLLSSGDNSCAIASNDNLYCWGEGVYGVLGNNTNAKSHVPVLVAGGDLGGRAIKSISKSNSLVCAISSDEGVYCWGRAQYAAFGVNSLFSSAVPKAVDFSGVLSGKKAKQVSLGSSFGCILADDNKVYCWGNNGRYSLGDGTTASFSSVPTAVALGGKTVKKLVVSGGVACIIANDDQVYCWGDGYAGQLGNNDDDTSNVPVAVVTSGVLSGKTIKDLYANNDKACAIANDDLPYCWGRGSLGNNDDSNYYFSVPVSLVTTGALIGKTITKLSVGHSYSCAIANDQKVYCWGEQSEGQLGNDSKETVNYPVSTITGLSEELIQDGVFVKTYAHQSEDLRICVQRSNGELYCGAVKSGLKFIHDFGSLNVKQIESSRDDDHACALMDDDNIYCWGRNFVGQLGNGTNDSSAVPTMIDMTGVLSGKSFKSLAIGNETTCVLASDEQVYCWGDGGDGLLGNGSNSNQRSPVAVSTAGVLNGKKVKSLHLNSGLACVIADDDMVYCWGNGGDGQLGNGDVQNSNIPVAISLNKKFKSLMNKGSSVCGITEDDYAYCWGDNQSGQLGIGANPGSDIPVQVDMSGVLNGKTIKKISSSGYTTCVIASDDLPYCFGYGQGGELGDNGLADSNIPTAVVTSGVLSGKKLIDIQVAENSVCVMDDKEDVYCWGNGSYYGEVGDGLSAVTPVPVKISF